MCGSAETDCESVHKAVPRNRYERGGQEPDDQGQFPVRGRSGWMRWEVPRNYARRSSESPGGPFLHDDQKSKNARPHGPANARAHEPDAAAWLYEVLVLEPALCHYK